MYPTNETIGGLTAQRAEALLESDLRQWPTAARNYGALRDVQTRTVRFGGCTIQVQFNPARLVSTGARTDAASISRRPCFLCTANRPAEQGQLPFLADYQLLVNPYPIFRHHYTIVERSHTPQRIGGRIGDFIELTRQLSGLTTLYNGPRCGASAPDHLHFQAVTQGQMPLDMEVTDTPAPDSPCVQTLLRSPEATLQRLSGCLRPLFVLRATTATTATAYFDRLYRALPLTPEDAGEPMINLIARYTEGRGWTVIVIPRRCHRPWEPGEGILAAPGAADMGGLFVSVRPEDFAVTDEDTLRTVYRAVCPTDEEMAGLTLEPA